MKTLFIGGVADGRWVFNPDPLPIIEIPVYPKASISVEYDESVPEFLNVTCETYIRRYLYGSRTRLYCYAEKSITDEQLLKKLIENYRPVTDVGDLK